MMKTTEENFTHPNSTSEAFGMRAAGSLPGVCSMPPEVKPLKGSPGISGLFFVSFFLVRNYGF